MHNNASTALTRATGIIIKLTKAQIAFALLFIQKFHRHHHRQQECQR